MRRWDVEVIAFTLTFALAIGLAVFVCCAGCSAEPARVGPPLAVQEAAMEVAWDGARFGFGMEPASRPSIEWRDGKGCASTSWMGATVTVKGWCETSAIDSDGRAVLAWPGDGTMPSQTDLPVVLGKWHQYLMTGAFHSDSPSELADEAKARDAMTVNAL